MTSSEGEVRAANEEDEKKTLGQFKGQKLAGANGEDLGKINDFVVDTQSGKIKFAVVSTGGFLGMGDKLRLVEHSSLEAKSAAEGFVAQMDKVAFEALPVITQADLDAGRISAGAAQQPATSSTSTAAESPTGKFALASKLSGKNVRADGAEAGTIDDVVVDIEKGQAHALFEARSEFAGSEGKYLVPVNKFEVGSPQAEVIATTLSRSDFGGSDQAVATTPSTTPATETLTPTGRSSSSETASTSTSPASAGTSSTSTTEPSSTSGISSTGTSTAGVTSPSVDRPDSSDPTSTTGSTGSPATAGATGTTGSSTSRIGSTDTSTTTPGSTTASSQSPSHTPDRDTSAVAGVGTTTSGAAVSTDEQLTPTGRTAAVQGASQSISPSSIRAALEQDSTLARENVQIEAKIVLRGTVSSETLKSRAEDVVRQAAGSAEIDNQIKVENK